MSTTRKQARQFIAQELGPWHESTATSGSSTSVLEDTAWPIKSTTQSDQAYKDHFLFRPAAANAGDLERSVATYDGPTGLLTPDRVWTAEPDSELYELLGVLPASVIHQAINDALKDLKVVVEFTVTPTVNTTRTSLTTAAAWLKDPSYVRQIGYLASGEVRNEVDPFRRVQRGTVTIDGESLYLNHGWRGYNATDTLYVRALKPAYYHCRSSDSGTFGEREGLSAEAHEAPVDVRWLTAAALVQLWRRYKHTLDAQADNGVLKSQLEAAAWLALEAERHFHNRLPPLTYKPVRYWGPAR